MINFLLFIFLALPSFAGTILRESSQVSPYTLPGDGERNHLPIDGLRWHESNDFFGRTDKLMTQASSLSFTKFWKDKYSTSLSYKGRFLQPVLKTKFGKKELPSPLGIYAEWAELMWNQSVLLTKDELWPALRLDGGIGYNDFGDHAFADYHRNIHSFVGSRNEENRYGKKADANFITTSVGASLILPLSDELNLIGSYQIMNSKIFREDTQEVSLVWRKSEDFAVSLKYGYVNQIRSQFYDLQNHRTQFIAAIRLFKIWTPSIMRVSTYVRGDKYGQIYLAPISLTYPF